MASSELAITDVFPMRKRRATGLTKPKTAKPQTIISEEKLGEKSTEACSKTPGKSIQTPPGKQPLKTPTRQQFPNAIGLYCLLNKWILILKIKWTNTSYPCDCFVSGIHPQGNR